MELNTTNTFDNFVVGKSNRMAYMAAKAVTQHPGTKYNPLWITGKSGLGKTHLLGAVFHEIHEHDPKTVIEAYTAEELTALLIKAAQADHVDALLSRLRQPDVLLIDDMQYLCGKSQTQAEFIRLLHALADNNHQAVITSSVEAKGLQPFADMYRRQFYGAASVDIQPLEDEECLELVRRKAMQEGLLLPEEAIVYISRHVGREARKIGGVIHHLKAEEELMGSVIEMDTVRKTCDAR